MKKKLIVLLGCAVLAVSAFAYHAVGDNPEPVCRPGTICK